MLKIKPVFSEKIWGGDKLQDIFKLKEQKTLGEAWIISGYYDNSSVIDGKESTLNQFYKENKELFNNYSTEDFPLLVKLIYAKTDLSIQVHPNDQQAQKYENYPLGKYESWVILDTIPNNKIIIGTKLKNKTTIRKAIAKGEWNNILETISIKNGDVFDISPGTLHAIKGGTLVYEIQQSSDITYRFYDYDRLDNEGKKRPLHIDKSLAVLDTNKKVNPKSIKNIYDFESNNSFTKELINNEVFSLNLWKIEIEENILVDQRANFLLITVIDGKGKINGKRAKQYDSFIITSDELKNKLEIIGELSLLVGNPK